MKKNIISAILLLALLPSLPTRAQDIREILSTIEQNNVQLQAVLSDGMAETAEAQSRNVPSAPGIEYSPFFTAGRTGVAASEMIVRQEFDFPTLYAERNRTTRKQQNLSEATYRTARTELLSAAQQLCIDLVKTNKNHALLQERLKISEDLQTLYQKKLSAGDATILEINKIKLECISRQTELENNLVERERITLQLQALNGGKPLRLDSISYPPAHHHIDPKGLIEQRRKTDTQLQALQSDEQLAQQQLRETRQQWLPKLSLGYRRNTAEEQASNGFLVGMSFPLWSTRKQVSAAQARHQATEHRTQQAEIEMENSVQALAAEYSHYLKSMAAYDLELLRNSLTLLNKAVQSGEISVIDYYTEVERIYEQWQTYHTLEHDCHSIHAEIHKNEL